MLRLKRLLFQENKKLDMVCLVEFNKFSQGYTANELSTLTNSRNT